MIRQQNRKDYSFYCVRYLSVLNRKVHSGIQIYTVWLDSIFRFKVLNIIYKLNNNTIVVSISFSLKTKEERTVVQFHFREWPDHGAPEHLSLLTFQTHVRKEKSRMVGKILVHCR